jgi:hypothetical protein
MIKAIVTPIKSMIACIFDDFVDSDFFISNIISSQLDSSFKKHLSKLKLLSIKQSFIAEFQVRDDK